MSDLPSREKWNTPHSVETAWDIAAEMTSYERRQISAAWLAGELMTAKEGWSKTAQRLRSELADERAATLDRLTDE